MIWLISQFPELEHLEEAQRAQLLKRVSWTAYFSIILNVLISALVIAAIAAGWTWVVFREPLITALAALTLGASAALYAYLSQIREIRLALRREIAEGFRGQRPPFCLACGYDLRAIPGHLCPECGVPMVAPRGVTRWYGAGRFLRRLLTRFRILPNHRR